MPCEYNSDVGFDIGNPMSADPSSGLEIRVQVYDPIGHGSA